MSKSKFMVFMSLVLTLAVFPWGIGQVWAQSQNANGNGNGSQNPPGQQWTLKDAMNASAALRKAQGMMQYTTGDDRLAAAQRNAARVAAANQGKGKNGSLNK